MQTMTNDPAAVSSKSIKKTFLSDIKLKGLKPANKAYKVSDRDGMYITVSPSGTLTFRYDYRIAGRRETLTIGRYDKTRGSELSRELNNLEYGIGLSLAEARLLLTRARRSVDIGQSPAGAKADKRAQINDAPTFGSWVTKYFEFKADPKSGDEQLADSTLEMRKSNYVRLLEKPLGKKPLESIKPTDLTELFDAIKTERGPGPAVHAREIVLLVFRYAIGKGIQVINPAEAIKRNTIATFKPRERTLNRREIKVFFDALQSTPTLPTLRLVIKYMLLTMVRKSEFIDATWKEINWERSIWTIPAKRMKANRDHVVYLSDQALDILTTLRTCFASGTYLHSGRYDSEIPISNATLNRVITLTVDRINEDLPDDAEPFETFSVHDLRRTASTLLNEAMFPEALVEACLAHQKKDQVAAAYNHAKHAGPRRALMNGWANMVDCWLKGESAIEVIKTTKIKIDDAAHDDSEMDL